MEGIRGFTGDMTATLGKGVYHYANTGTYIEAECKARRNGFHFVEYAPDCLSFYTLGRGNRYFLIDASGDINEEEGCVCSCTRMTLKKELTPTQFVIKTIEYMVRNPRMNWERQGYGYQIARERAETDLTDGFAIARGTAPQVRGVRGSIIGLVIEDGSGYFRAARVITAPDGRAYTLAADGKVKTV